MSKKALIRALSKSKSKGEIKRKPAQSDIPNEAWQDATDELYNAIKNGDEAGFKETLKAVIQIANSED